MAYGMDGWMDGWVEDGWLDWGDRQKQEAIDHIPHQTPSDEGIDGLDLKFFTQVQNAYTHPTHYIDLIPNHIQTMTTSNQAYSMRQRDVKNYAEMDEGMPQTAEEANAAAAAAMVMPQPYCYDAYSGYPMGMAGMPMVAPMVPGPCNKAKPKRKQVKNACGTDQVTPPGLVHD